MQKKLIALAVAGLASTAAFAQSNVTIYGVVDAGYVVSSGDRVGANAKNANYSGIDSGLLGGSRIGFKGEEGLGNGLKAIFTLEYYIAPDINSGLGSAPTLQGAGGSTSASRQTFVGLSHNKYGTVTLGRQYAAGFYAVVRNDAFGGAAIGALPSLNLAGGNSIIAGNGARLNNSVVYASPKFSGFSAVAGYSFAEGGGTTNNGISQGNGGIATAGLNYANGPLNLDLAVQQRRGISGNVQTATTGTTITAIPGQVNTQDNVTEWIAGGSYDFKVVKLFATYQDQNDGNGTSRTEISNRVWQVGATVPVFGNGKIHGSYARLNWDNSTDTINGSSSAWALGYTHALSKRTTLYTAYTRVSNDSDARVAAGPVGNTRAIGEANSTFSAGINHSF